MTTSGYEAVNARGVILCTFSELDLARAWVRERAAEHSGLHLVEVTVLKRPVYRPRPATRPTLVVDNSDHIEAALAARKLEAMP
jgi:hypothetical protein